MKLAKSSGVSEPAFDLLARVGEQADDGEGADQLDERGRHGLLEHVLQVGAQQLLRGVAETAGLVRFGVEGFDDHVAAQRLLQDLVELALFFLRAAAGAADAASDLARRQDHERQDDEAEQREPPILADDDQGQHNSGEELAEQVGEDVGDGDLHLIDIVHDRRHQPAGGLRLEEFGALLLHLVEDGVAEVRDRGEADVVDEVVPEIIADALDQEDAEQRDGDHGPDIVDGGGDEAVQVDAMVEDRVGVEKDGTVGGAGVEDLIEDGADEERHHAGGRAGDRHQNDGAGEVDCIAAGIGDEAQEFVHAATLRRDKRFDDLRGIGGEREDLTDGAPRAPDVAVGGAEEDDDGEAEGGGHMGGPGVVADEEGGAGEEGFDVGERGLEGGVEGGEVVGRGRR